MSDKPYNVLFLCTGNSARSVLGEVLMRDLSKGKAAGLSAGSQPKGDVHPVTLKVLAHFGHDTAGLRSKSWDEFAAADAPQMDFVFTVCDNAAHETCPVWPGQPMTAHWGIPDPAAATGSDAEIHAAFMDAYGRMRNRVELFLALPFASLDRIRLQKRVREIGATAP